MDPERWRRLQEMFERAVELPAGERPAYLSQACGDDQELHRQLQSMLESTDDGGDVIAGAIDGVRARLRAAGLPVPGDRIDAWVILEELGQGGMGRVYLAARDDHEFEQRVAIKLMRSTLDPTLLARFRAERQILARLEHPHIARLLDGGSTASGEPYVVMELVEGLPLDRYCDDNRLSIRERLELFLHVCEAVAYAHRNLVVHRDLKPSNILVTTEGQPKLLDFGIAKLLARDDTDTDTASTLGGRPMTPRYASPEQAAGEAVTTASDIYSLGVVLYELLAGGPPFDLEGKTPLQVERIVRSSEPRKPSTRPSGQSTVAIAQARATEPDRLRRRLAGDLDNIVLKTLRKEPEERYRSVGELADDLRRHLTGLPVLARPATVGYLVRKFVRRRAPAVAAAAIGLVLLVGTVAFYTVRLRRERDMARLSATKATEVTQFLTRLFRKPSGAPEDREPTARELLEAGAEQALSGEASDPQSEAALLHALGEVHAELGHYDESERFLRHSLERRLELFGEDHVEVAESRAALGALLLDRGDITAARSELETALAIRERVLGPRAREIGSTLVPLAETIRFAGDFAAAVPLQHRAVEILEHVHGVGHVRTANVIGRLGVTYRDLGRYDEAETELRRAAAIFEERLGAEHPDRADPLHNLGLTLILQGKLEEALAVYEEALQIRERALGPHHPWVSFVLGGYGIALVLLDRPGEALPICTRALELQRPYAEEAFDYGTFLTLEADARAGLAEVERAERLYRQALESFAANASLDHHLSAEPLQGLAGLLQRRGELAEARSLLEHALEIRRKYHGDEHPLVAESLDDLGRQARLEGRLDEADVLYREAIAIREPLLAAGHPGFATSLIGRATVLLERDRPGEAESLLTEALAIRLRRFPSGHFRVAEARAALAAALAAQGRLGEAEPLFERAEAALDGASAGAELVRYDFRRWTNRLNRN